MGLIRKALFFGTAATGMPLVRGRSSAEAAAVEQRQLMEQQNSILSDLARSQRTSQIYSSSELVVNHVLTGTPVAEPSLTDRLTEIKGLLERGLITEEEFSAMRKNALGL